MARIARVVVPGCPHHVTQRGVRKLDVFFSDADRDAYVSLLAEHGARTGLRFLAWCLMRNHVHLIVVPEDAAGLARGIGEAHRLYTRRVNFRQGWRGYLFQGRFYSCPLERVHILAAVRYVLRNPVRAGLVLDPADYVWSSARWMVGRAAHDPLAVRSSLLADVSDWAEFLAEEEDGLGDIRLHTRTGRPLGGDDFLDRVEHALGRRGRPRTRGRKPRK
ncbi:MAG: transposase [Candidatus Bipolaricaulota bacterium]|nr:MAG: transposase [Candidatus Bipolaricaulota bacterium]